MDADGYVAHIEVDGARLAEVAEGNLGRPVPSCPEWTVAELVGHLGEVHHFWRHAAAEPGKRPEPFTLDSVPKGEARVPWFREQVAALADVLQAADPKTPVWTWTATDDTVAWIQRRMGHETAVHRWDGEVAVGTTTPVDAALAVDGVDEFFDVFLPAAGPMAWGSGTIHLHATDHEGEWLIRLDDDQISVERGHAKGEVAVRASASDLLLLLWRRVPQEQLETFGDAGLLERFIAQLAID